MRQRDKHFGKQGHDISNKRPRHRWQPWLTKSPVHFPFDANLPGFQVHIQHHCRDKGQQPFGTVAIADPQDGVGRRVDQTENPPRD
jgi:hypothetical protein